MAGRSSGGVTMAIEQVRDEIADGASARRYCPTVANVTMNTIYCDEWVRAHFCDADRLYAEEEMLEPCLALA